MSEQTEAINRIRKAAEQGDVYAQFTLGFMYVTGRGVRRSYHEAAKWYRKASEQGHALAKDSLEHMETDK